MNFKNRYCLCQWLAVILTVIFLKSTGFALGDLNVETDESQQIISSNIKAASKDVIVEPNNKKNELAISEEAKLYDYLPHNFIIIPAIWIDGAVTEIFAILIPVQGVAAYDMADAMKDVDKAIKGSNENLKKNKQAYLDGLKAAQKGQEQINAIHAHLQKSPELQEILSESQNIMESLNKEFAERQNAQTKDLIADLEIKLKENVFVQNQKTIKEFLENIVASDAAESLKNKTIQALNIIDSGIQNINPALLKDIFIESLGGGLKAHLFCDLTFTASGLVIAGPIGATTMFASCQPICAALGAAGATTRGIQVGLDNVHFRKESSADRPTINQAQQQVYREQAPKSVERVDEKRDYGSQHHEKEHVHFKGGHALNKDGTWKHGGRKLSNSEKQWLEQIGWRAPNEQ